jgi:peptidyl-prolyl cis-trans isomerase SurA
VDYAQLREQIRNEIMITKLRQKEVESRVVVSDQDVDTYLQGKDAQAETENEYRLSHILIAVPSDATEEQLQAARKTAAEILDRLRKGADFANEAVAHSGDDQALNGGDLGWRAAAALPTIFAKVVPRMEKGGVSDVISDASGMHIIKLVDVRHGDSQKIVKETHARHILLKPNAIRGEAATRAEAEDLRRQLDEGADFATLAKAHSEDPGSANQGGDLGWTAAGSFVKPFQDALDDMKPGEIRGPISTQFGLHIVQLLDRRERDTGKDYVREKARSAIFQRKVAEEYDQWLRRLRDEAYVEFRSPSDAAAFQQDDVSGAADVAPGG